MRKKNLFTAISIESAFWRSKGIINDEQRNEILSLYDQPQKKSAHINIAAVITALAVVSISAGLLIFYAANWRKISPQLRFIQILLLLCITYGSAWYFIFKRKSSALLGRALLILGMVSFGAGIMLVAQTYHISSHPANGILVWGLGALAMSVLMKERWGYFLSAGLFFIWHQWELYVFDNPCYLYLIFLACIMVLFLRLKDNAGTIVITILSLIFFWEVNAWHVSSSADAVSAGSVFILLHLPAGAAILALSSFAKKQNDFMQFSSFCTAAGIVFVLIPFFCLSWPSEMGHSSALVLLREAERYAAVQYCAALIACFGFMIVLIKRNISLSLILPFFVMAAVGACIPLGSITARMIYLHVSIIAAAAVLLYYPHLYSAGIEKVMGLLFVILLLLVKGTGFFLYAMKDSEYRAAYLIGFIIFGTVIFLINDLVWKRLDEKKIFYQRNLITSFIGVLCYLTLYALSFELSAQQSIFSADRIVVTMLILFTVLAVFLFASLAVRSGWTVRTVLALIVALCSWLTLALSGPGLPRQSYSVVFNILLLIFVGTLIYYSTVIQSKILLNAAVAAFVLHVGTRYIDIFWDMLSGSALFIITGIIGLAGGWILEKKRRQVSRMIDGSAPRRGAK